jgi:hypothetical protein
MQLLVLDPLQERIYGTLPDLVEDEASRLVDDEHRIDHLSH